MRIPREQVAMLAPSPLGGRLRYHGPFIEDEWTMANAVIPGWHATGVPDSGDKDEAGKPNKDQPGRWVFSGSAWYWANRQSGTALLRENAMPDRSILRFDLAWKNRLVHRDRIPRRLRQSQTARGWRQGSEEPGAGPRIRPR